MENHGNSKQPRKAGKKRIHLESGVTPVFQYILDGCKQSGMSINELVRKLNESDILVDRSTIEKWKKHAPNAIQVLYGIQTIFKEAAIIPTATAGNHRRFHDETPAIE